MDMPFRRGEDGTTRCGRLESQEISARFQFTKARPTGDACLDRLLEERADQPMLGTSGESWRRGNRSGSRISPAARRVGL